MTQEGISTNIPIDELRNIVQSCHLNEINNQYFPVLYTKDAKGKIRQWQIWIGYKQNNDQPYIFIEHGLQDGKKQLKEEAVPEGKNKGKKNETTPLEQAFIVARKYFNRQWDKNYRPSLDQLDAVEQQTKVLPMLAQDYLKHWKKMVFPCYVQPKVDGIRCIATKVNDEIVFTTRRGKEIQSIDHLKPKLQSVMEEGEVIDGELYRHDMSFQDLTSSIRKQKENDPNIEYHVYDLVSEQGYERRYERLKEIVSWMDSHIYLLETNQIFDESEIRTYHDYYISNGYEGLIIRNPQGGYEKNKRSYKLLKFKDFDDHEFRIVDVVEGKKQQGIFVCETEDQQTFNVRTRGTDEYREYILQSPDEFIGKMLTVRFFGYSVDGIPRFPVGITVRDYE